MNVFEMAFVVGLGIALAPLVVYIIGIAVAGILGAFLMVILGVSKLLGD